MLKTSRTLFGGSHLHHMISEDEIQKLLKHFNKISGIILPEKTHNKEFLGPHNFNILSNSHYYALGIPEDNEYYLFLTLFENKNYAFLINKYLTPGFKHPKCIILDLNVKELCYDDTIIDVTRVYVTKGRFLLLLTDVLYMNGKNVKNENFIDRLEILGEFMKNNYNEDLKRQPFRIQIVRPFINLNNLEKKIKSLPYKIDKIMFKPLENNKKTLHYTLE